MFVGVERKFQFFAKSGDHSFSLNPDYARLQYEFLRYRRMNIRDNLIPNPVET